MLLIIHQIQQSIFNKWFGTILKMLTYFRFISENIKFQRWTFTNKYTSSDFYLYLIDGFGSAACVIAGPSTVTSPLPDAMKFCWVARASVRDSRQRERSEAMELKVTHAFRRRVWHITATHVVGNQPTKERMTHYCKKNLTLSLWWRGRARAGLRFEIR